MNRTSAHVHTDLARQQRRRVLKLLGGGALMPVASAFAVQEIDIPQDQREIVSSPSAPWEPGGEPMPSALAREDWPEPVVQVDSAADIPLANAIINTAGKGTWVWGKGVFDIPAVTDLHTALYFANLSAFHMTGMGAEHTTLRQSIAPAKVTGQLRLMAFENIGRLDIADFSMDGQRERYDVPNTPAHGENTHWQGIGEPAYQLHNNREAMNNIFMRNIGSGSLRALHNVSSRGDFLNMANVSNLLVHGCDIADCGRNGITLGGVRGLEWSRNIEISHCRFHGDIDTQMIDLELHGDEMATPAQFNRNLYIHDCVFEPQTPDDTIDMDQFAIVLYAVMDFRVERCEILGPVIVRNGHGVLRNNTGGITQLTVDRFSSADVENCRFSLVPQLRDANRNVCGILVVRRDDVSPSRFAMTDCHISCSGLDSDIEIHDCPELVLTDNHFTGNRGAASLLLAARDTSMQATVRGNTGLDAPRLYEADHHRVLIDEG